MSDKIIQKVTELEKRIIKLEGTVFGINKLPEKVSHKEYSGPKGGIQFLIDKNLFPKKATTLVIKELMEKNDYQYKRQVIQTALNRLSKPGGLLVTFVEKGIKIYAKRK